MSVLDCYATLPRRDRMHVRGRWASCPIPAVEAEVPRVGRILDVGCGHGLVSLHLAHTSPDRTVVGTDIDARKIELANRAAATIRSHARPRFEHRADGSLPDGEWDAIVVVDVLYLLDRDREQALLDACVQRLAPNGVLVLKETDVTPRWKHRLALVQELVATRVARVTAGSTVAFTPVEELVGSLRGRGLDVRHRRVDRGYLHPHALVVARRTAW
ncbi:MAG TPA: class I SAM-dependent methyltransferase [Acidimicrobiales bacterium]